MKRLICMIRLICIALVLAMFTSMLPQYVFAVPYETDVLVTQLKPQYGHNYSFLAPIDTSTPTGTPISDSAGLAAITMNGTYYLTGNIDMTGVTWTPLGTSASPFTGTIDGRGYEIQNLTVDVTVNNSFTDTTNTQADEAYAGLFKYVGDGAKFKNLGLDATINVKTTADSTIDVAKLTAPTSNTSVYNYLHPTVYVGSLFAYSTGNISISNCYNKGAILVISALYVKTHATSTPSSFYAWYYAHSELTVYAGGIYGYSYSGNIDISDCYNSNDIVANLDLRAESEATYLISDNPDEYPYAYAYTYANAYVGGIYGYGAANTNITNSYNSGNVTSLVTLVSTYNSGGIINNGSINRNLYSGGLLAYSPGGAVNINNSYNSGDIGSDTSSTSYSGGLLGRGDKYIDISNSYNTGDIKGYYAGGIYGYSNSAANLRSTTNSGEITGGRYAGGIYAYSHSSAANTRRSYNTGDVVSQNSYGAAGGICGYTSSSASISDCYNKGTITVSSYETYAGGIIGRNNGSDAGSGSVSVIVSECYNVGNVTSNYNYNYTGGICGYNAGSLPADIKASCYWLTGAGNAAKGVGNGEDNTTDLTDSDMKRQTSYGGFNFFNVWIIDERQNDGYPYLRASNTNVGIKYSDSLDDIVVPGWIDGVALEGRAPAEINLEVEQLILRDEFDIRAFSVDGGVTWKNVRKQFDPKNFPKLLDKGMTLHIADAIIDKETKEPFDDANIIIFQTINKRPDTPKSHIRYGKNSIALAPNYEAGADTTGDTLGTWLLAGIHGSKSDTVYLPIADIDNLQIGVADLKNKTVDYRGYGTFYTDDLTQRPKGIPVESYSRKIVKTSYYIRIAPSYEGGVYTAASKPRRIYSRGASKAPRYKIKKDGTIKVKADTYVKIGNGVPVIYREATVIDVGFYDTIEIWKAATPKKAASEKQVILPTMFFDSTAPSPSPSPTP